MKSACHRVSAAHANCHPYPTMQFLNIFILLRNRLHTAGLASFYILFLALMRITVEVVILPQHCLYASPSSCHFWSHAAAISDLPLRVFPWDNHARTSILEDKNAMPERLTNAVHISLLHAIWFVAMGKKLIPNSQKLKCKDPNSNGKGPSTTPSCRASDVGNSPHIRQVQNDIPYALWLKQ